ncbi:ETC complex I subunit [Salinarimonas chemoclinalis]|uniref:ETC complex I subunit n=1 Tax=Salinarimonas chemoclinalis TaxID=3241599 RepID=UPI0035578C6C
MTARIFKPSRGATSSGKARTRRWVLRFDPASPRRIEPLMGWTASTDTRQQVQLSFDTREQAVAYAEREGIAYVVDEPEEPTRKVISYSDNFKHNRVGPWTH